MKRIKRFVLLVVTILLLSGCVKNNVTMRINSDKSMTFEVLVLADEEYKNQLSSNFNSSELENRGFKVSTNNKDNYSGYKITKKFDNIDKLSNGNNEVVDISNILNSDFDFSKLFTRKESFFKDTYTANLKYSLNTVEKNYLNGDDRSIEDKYADSLSLLDQVELKYVLVLPTKAISNDANETSSDLKYLSWKLSKISDSKMNYSFDIYNIKNIAIVGGGSLLFITILIVIIVIIKKKKSSKATLIYKEYDPSIEEKLNKNEVINDNKEEVQKEVNVQVEENKNNEVQTANIEEDISEGMQVLTSLELPDEKVIESTNQPSSTTTNSFSTLDRPSTIEEKIEEPQQTNPEEKVNEVTSTPTLDVPDAIAFSDMDNK